MVDIGTLVKNQMCQGCQHLSCLTSLKLSYTQSCDPSGQRRSGLEKGVIFVFGWLSDVHPQC